jgi:hypothetical protein
VRIVVTILARRPNGDKSDKLLGSDPRIDPDCGAGPRHGRGSGAGVPQVLDELNAPPSCSRFWPTMKPTLAKHRKA